MQVPLQKQMVQMRDVKCNFVRLFSAAPTVPVIRKPPALPPLQLQVFSAAPTVPELLNASQKRLGSDNVSDLASTCSADVASSSDICTTVIMRNIPNRFSVAALAAMLDKHGFCGAYDLIYLPVDFATGVSFGYAFVNLTTNEKAERLIATFDGFSQWGGSSKKVCCVVPCHDNETPSERVERYRNLPVMHSSVPDAFKPAMYFAGQRVPFPSPTKTLRPPRVGKKQ